MRMISKKKGKRNASLFFFSEVRGYENIRKNRFSLLFSRFFRNFAAENRKCLLSFLTKPIKIMNKNLVHSCILLLITFLFAACSREDTNSAPRVEYININDNGTTSDGSSFVKIDSKSFYLNYIKYTIEEAHIVVTGFDQTGGKTVNIATAIRYKSNLYHVTSIGRMAFYGCSNLTSISIPSSVTTIGASAFAGCSSLTSISIPKDVISMEENVFADCSGLTSIIIPDDMKSISEGMLKGCSSLTAVTIPNSVTSIGREAFYGCSGLTSITIPSGVKSIGDYAFENCKTLTTITIPDGISTIGREMFSGCSGLTSINLPNSVITIRDYAFAGCSGLTSFTFPREVTNIGYAAFSHCTGLTTLNLPNSVTAIESGAFAYCTNLSSIIIPSSIKNIHTNAFIECKGLKDVYCYAEQVPSPNTTIFDVASCSSATLHVPAASIDAYKESSAWVNFKNIVALTDSDPKPIDAN